MKFNDEITKEQEEVVKGFRIATEKASENTEPYIAPTDEKIAIVGDVNNANAYKEVSVEVEFLFDKDFADINNIGYVEKDLKDGIIRKSATVSSRKMTPKVFANINGALAVITPYFIKPLANGLMEYYDEEEQKEILTEKISLGMSDFKVTNALYNCVGGIYDIESDMLEFATFQSIINAFFKYVQTNNGLINQMLGFSSTDGTKNVTK